MSWKLDQHYIEPELGEFREQARVILVLTMLGRAHLAGLCHFEDEPPYKEVLAERNTRYLALLRSVLRVVDPHARQAFAFINDACDVTCPIDAPGHAALLQPYDLEIPIPLYEYPSFYLKFALRCPVAEHGGMLVAAHFPEHWAGDSDFSLSLCPLPPSALQDTCDCCPDDDEPPDYR